MTPKLASAIVCLGIAVGSLSAPKFSPAGGKAGGANPAVKPLDSIDTPLESVTESLEFSTGALPTGQPGTNTLGVALQQ